MGYIFHPLCKLCKLKTDNRSIFAECALSRISKACRFEKNGCKVKITEKNCHHEKDECWFRKTCCFFCYDEMPMNQFYDHLKQFHLDYLSYSNLPFGTSFGKILNEIQGFFNIPDLRFEETFSKKEWNSIHYMKLDEESHFFFDCWLTNCSESRLNIWVYFLGPPVDAKKFAFQLRMSNEESEKEIQISGPVVSVETEKMFALTRPLAIMMTLDEICEFWSLDHPKFFWQLMVFKKTLISEFNQYNRIYFSRSAECMNQEQITKI
jgi:hypothetical protein